jgi:hypothetical protein
MYYLNFTIDSRFNYVLIINNIYNIFIYNLYMIKKKESVSKKISKEKVKAKSAPKLKAVPKTKVEAKTKKKAKTIKKEVDLVSDSLNLAKTLNKEIAKVAVVKDSLKNDLQKLTQRVDAHDKKVKTSSSNTSSSIHNNFLSTIKDEIISEFTPLINKLDLKSVKVDIFDEIKKIIEVESQKLRSELDSKSSKHKKDFSKKLSDLEIRIIDSLNANNSLKKELKKIEDKDFKGLNAEIEKKVHDSIKKINDKFFTLFSSSTIDIDELKVNTKKLERRLDSLKKDVKKNFSIEDLDLSSIESKIKKLEVENGALKSLIERFENELFNKKKSETFEVEKRVQKNLVKTETKLKDLEIAKDAQEKFLVDKFNEVADFVSGIEKKIISLEKKDLSSIEKKSKDNLTKELVAAEEKLRNLFLKKQKDLDFNLKNFEEEISSLSANATAKLESSYIKIDREREMLLEDVNKSKEDMTTKLNNKFNDMSIKFDLKLNPVVNNLKKDKNKYKEYIDKFKIEISHLVKKYVSELDKELKILKSSDTNFKTDKKDAFKEIDSRFVKQIDSFSKDYAEFVKQVSTSVKTLEKEKELERDFLANKYNEIADKFDDLSKKNDEDLKEEKKILEQEVKDEISKQILNDTNHLNKITQENKDELTNLKEVIESKFLIAKEQFESSFITKLSDFDNELKSKESEFLEKLSIIEVDKNKMVEELGSFKDEITLLTKNYVSNLDDELQKIKAEEAKFDREVEDFGIHVQEIVKARKLELTDYSKKLEGELFEVLKSQKENFERNENTFRETFNEKISNLKDYTKNRLDSIEKRFIEKNLKYVTDQIENGLNDLNVYNERIKTKEAEINAKFEEFELFQQNSFVEMKAEKDRIGEGIEERVMGLEQKFNKRFLDYGSDISDFKGVIIDELDGFMRDTNSVLAKKLDQIDTSFAKVNFINNEIKRSFDKIKEIENKVDFELRGIRDDVSDVRVKLEVIDGGSSHSINDHVQYMSAYEDQLLSLIDSLKNRGIANDQIMAALTNKGHPRFYVAMILENYTKLLN